MAEPVWAGMTPEESRTEIADIRKSVEEILKDKSTDIKSMISWKSVALKRRSGDRLPIHICLQYPNDEQIPWDLVCNLLHIYPESLMEVGESHNTTGPMMRELKAKSDLFKSERTVTSYDNWHSDTKVFRVPMTTHSMIFLSKAGTAVSKAGPAVSKAGPAVSKAGPADRDHVLDLCDLIYGCLKIEKSQKSCVVHICGNRFAGKSTLFKRLKESKLQTPPALAVGGFLADTFFRVKARDIDIKDRTRGLVSEVVERPGFNVLVCDYGGDVEFQINHADSLSEKHSVYVIVLALWNKDPKNKGLFNVAAIRDAYEHWLRFIYTTTPGSAERQCVTIINKFSTCVEHTKNFLVDVNEEIAEVRERFDSAFVFADTKTVDLNVYFDFRADILKVVVESLKKLTTTQKDVGVGRSALLSHALRSDHFSTLATIVTREDFNQALKLMVSEVDLKLRVVKASEKDHSRMQSRNLLESSLASTLLDAMIEVHAISSVGEYIVTKRNVLTQELVGELVGQKMNKRLEVRSAHINPGNTEYWTFTSEELASILAEKSIILSSDAAVDILKAIGLCVPVTQNGTLRYGMLGLFDSSIVGHTDAGNVSVDIYPRQVSRCFCLLDPNCKFVPGYFMRLFGLVLVWAKPTITRAYSDGLLLFYKREGSDHCLLIRPYQYKTWEAFQVIVASVNATKPHDKDRVMQDVATISEFVNRKTYFWGMQPMEYCVKPDDEPTKKCTPWPIADESTETERNDCTHYLGILAPGAETRNHTVANGQMLGRLTGAVNAVHAQGVETQICVVANGQMLVKMLNLVRQNWERVRTIQLLAGKNGRRLNGLQLLGTEIHKLSAKNGRKLDGLELLISNYGAKLGAIQQLVDENRSKLIVVEGQGAENGKKLDEIRGQVAQYLTKLGDLEQLVDQNGKLVGDVQQIIAKNGDKLVVIEEMGVQIAESVLATYEKAGENSDELLGIRDIVGQVGANVRAVQHTLVGMEQQGAEIRLLVGENGRKLDGLELLISNYGAKLGAIQQLVAENRSKLIVVEGQGAENGNKLDEIRGQVAQYLTKLGDLEQLVDKNGKLVGDVQRMIAKNGHTLVAIEKMGVQIAKKAGENSDELLGIRDIVGQVGANVLAVQQVAVKNERRLNSLQLLGTEIHKLSATNGRKLDGLELLISNYGAKLGAIQQLVAENRSKLIVVEGQGAENGNKLDEIRGQVAQYLTKLGDLEQLVDKNGKLVGDVQQIIAKNGHTLVAIEKMGVQIAKKAGENSNELLGIRDIVGQVGANVRAVQQVAGANTTNLSGIKDLVETYGESMVNSVLESRREAGKYPVLVSVTVSKAKTVAAAGFVKAVKSKASHAVYDCFRVHFRCPVCAEKGLSGDGESDGFALNILKDRSRTVCKVLLVTLRVIQVLVAISSVLPATVLGPLGMAATEMEKLLGKNVVNSIRDVAQSVAHASPGADDAIADALAHASPPAGADDAIADVLEEEVGNFAKGTKAIVQREDVSIPGDNHGETSAFVSRATVTVDQSYLNTLKELFSFLGLDVNNMSPEKIGLKPVHHVSAEDRQISSAWVCPDCVARYSTHGDSCLLVKAVYKEC